MSDENTNESNVDEIVIPVPGDSNTGENEMPVDLHEQNMGQIAQLGVQLQQSGIIAQNNFITVQKSLDYDYLEGKRIVDLTEALGVREVSSTTVPAGPSKAP